MSVTFAIIAEQLDLAPFAKGREGWVTWLAVGEPVRSWQREDLGIDSPGELSVDYVAGDFYDDFRDLFQEVLDAAPGDVVVLQLGSELLRRKDGEIVFSDDPDGYWKDWLRRAA